MNRPLWIGALGLLVLAALVVAFLAIHAARPCEGVDVEEISDHQRTLLIERGWRGIPGDGREALYPRGCVEPAPAEQYDGTLTPGSGV